MFRSDLRKKGVCSKSATKMLYRYKFLVSECIFKLVCYCRLAGYQRSFETSVIAETSLNKLLLFLILKSSRRSYSVGKGVLKTFTGKHFCWSLFLIKLQALVPAAQVLSTEICKIFKNTYLKTTVSPFKSLFIVHEKETVNYFLKKFYRRYLTLF